MSKKKLIFGIAAGFVAIGGIVAVIVKHSRKKALEAYDYSDDDDDDEFWDDDLDDECDCNADMKCCDYAEQILRELEEGTYGK